MCLSLLLDLLDLLDLVDLLDLLDLLDLCLSEDDFGAAAEEGGITASLSEGEQRRESESNSEDKRTSGEELMRRVRELAQSLDHRAAAVSEHRSVGCGQKKRG